MEKKETKSKRLVRKDPNKREPVKFDKAKNRPSNGKAKKPVVKKAFLSNEKTKIDTISDKIKDTAKKSSRGIKFIFLKVSYFLLNLHVCNN